MPHNYAEIKHHESRELKRVFYYSVKDTTHNKKFNIRKKVFSDKFKKNLKNTFFTELVWATTSALQILQGFKLILSIHFRTTDINTCKILQLSKGSSKYAILCVICSRSQICENQMLLKISQKSKRNTCTRVSFQ